MRQKRMPHPLCGHPFVHVILRFNVSPEGPGVPQAVRRDIGIACLDYVTPVRKTIQLLTNLSANTLKTIFLADHGDLISDSLGQPHQS